jgi:hypothetical protein
MNREFSLLNNDGKCEKQGLGDLKTEYAVALGERNPRNQEPQPADRPFRSISAASSYFAACLTRNSSGVPRFQQSRLAPMTPNSPSMTSQRSPNNRASALQKAAAVDGPGEKVAIRELTAEEIQRLERALGQPIDHMYLVHWMSHSINALVQVASVPSARQLRDDLTRMAREGRQWIRSVAEYPPDILWPRAGAERDRLIEAAEGFCQSIDLMASQAGSLVKRGNTKTYPAFQALRVRRASVRTLLASQGLSQNIKSATSDRHAARSSNQASPGIRRGVPKACGTIGQCCSES